LGGKKEIKSAEEGGDDNDVTNKNDFRLFHFTDENGKNEFNEVKSENMTYSLLNTKDVFILDAGDKVFSWVGNEASENEKKNALIYSKNYLGIYNRPVWIPILKVNEGSEPKDFFEVLKK
jgi:gelsolin